MLRTDVTSRPLPSPVADASAAARSTRRGVALTAVAALTVSLAALAPSVAVATSTATGPAASVIAGSAALAPDAPPVAFPRHPGGLPRQSTYRAGLDDPAGYQMQQACVAAPSRGIVKLRALALKTYGRGGSSPATPRACTSGSTSEHKDGRAWDWMVDVHNRADRRAAADFLAWVTGPGPSGARGEMARRLGLMYVIYNHKSWASYRGTWEAYSGADPHTSHVHISLSWNGARAHTSFWTGHAWATDYGTCVAFRGQPALAPTAKPRLSPCNSPTVAPRLSRLPLLWMGSAGATVSKAQRLLNQPVTGTFGAAFRAAVLNYQGSHDLARTGAVDKPTWASLVPSSRRMTAPTWTRREAAQWGRSNAAETVLRRGSTGRAVYALQIALGVPDDVRNGLLGRRTAAAVKAFKADHGLARNTVVNKAVWQAL